MKRSILGALALYSTIAFSSFGCGSDSSDENANNAGKGGGSSSSEDNLTVLSWWVAPGEAEALQALLDTYQEAYPEVRVSDYDNATSSTWRQVLAENIESSPWDVFQMSASDIADLKADFPDDLVSMDEIYAEPSLQDNVIPEIHAATTVDGVSYGVVTGVHRNNSFLFNKQILDEEGIDPPETMDEFLDVCAQLKEAGIMPVAATFQTWALRIMLDGIMAGTMGAQEFYDFVNADGPPADDAIRADIETAIDTFDLVLTEYVDNEVSREADYGFAQATESLHSGDAVMFFHGDWAKGYLVSVGWTAGVDFGVSGPPGASDLFVYGADMFAMPVSAQHPNNARNFLSVLASKEAQVAFNRFKGSTPMRMDARDELDEPGKLALDNLIEAKVLMKGHPNDDWDAAIEAYVADGDKAALLEVYLTADP